MLERATSSGGRALHHIYERSLPVYGVVMGSIPRSRPIITAFLFSFCFFPSLELFSFCSPRIFPVFYHLLPSTRFYIIRFIRRLRNYKNSGFSLVYTLQFPIHVLFFPFIFLSITYPTFLSPCFSPPPLPGKEK